MDRGLLLGEEAGLEGGCWVLLCTSQPGGGQAPRRATSGQVGSGPRAGEACVSTLLAVRPPPLTLLSRRLDSVLPAPPPAAALGPRGELTTEPTPWTPSGMLGIQLVLNNTSNEGESSHGDPVDTAGFWAAFWPVETGPVSAPSLPWPDQELKTAAVPFSHSLPPGPARPP